MTSIFLQQSYFCTSVKWSLCVCVCLCTHVVVVQLLRPDQTLRPHRLQHARLPCPSLFPGVCLNSCPLNRWCHPTTSSSVVPLLLLPSVFPSIKVLSNESAFRIRWPQYWSFSFSISPSNEYWGLISFRIDWFDLLASKRLSRVFSNTTVQKHHTLTLNLIYGQTLTSIHDYWKNHSFD